MLFLKRGWKTSFLVLILWVSVYAFSDQLRAQSIPQIPFDIDFAGVTVHMNEESRLLLQREVGQLYANRTGLHRDIESLRQLTPLLEPLLKAEHLPMDYRYAVLPFIGTDSTGYWGLNQERALSLKMVVNKAIDERYHPVLATEAVTAHLGRLHTAPDNYVLTLLKYIQGDTFTNRFADKVNSTYILLDAKSPLLIWKIIARKLAFEREEPILRPAQTYLLYEYRNGAGYSLRTINRQLRLDENRFRPFNTWLKTTIIPDEKEYPVLIRVTADEFPVIKSQDEVRWKRSVAGQRDVGFPVISKLPQSSEVTYESAVFYTINDRLGVQAQPCDNVITLAHYGKITIKTFLSNNELSQRDVIQPGHIYYLERKAKRAKVPFHVVQKNQTLREIADVYGVQLKSLLQFNRFQPTQRIQTGRIVWMQKKRPRQQPIEYSQQPADDVKPIIDDAPADSTSMPMILTNSMPKPLTPSDSMTLQFATKPAQTATADREPVETSLRNEDLAEEKAIPANTVDETGEPLKLHVVQPKQTYHSISQLYGVTTKQLYAWNNLSERIPLQVGQELILDLTKKQLPVRSIVKVVTRPKAPPRPAKMINAFLVEPAGRIAYHIVQAGQTVYRVALINKVSVPDLIRWNKLKDNTIEIGQKLLIMKGK